MVDVGFGPNFLFPCSRLMAFLIFGEDGFATDDGAEDFGFEEGRGRDFGEVLGEDDEIGEFADF